MSENYIKQIEVFSNIISLSKLLEIEINKVTKDLSVSHFELNVLFYIADKETTQYRLAKKYNVSIQRIHNIIKKFLEKGYIIGEGSLENGRELKKLYLCLEVKEKLDIINQKITKKFQEKNITYSNLNRLDDALCTVSEKLSRKF